MDKMIVYEDDALFVVHKPSGIATQTARIGQADIVSGLKNMRRRNGEPIYVGVVHRLDQPVEGLLVFAKNAKAAAALTEQLGTGALKKTYAALVAGSIPEGTGAGLTDYLAKEPRANLSKVVEKGADGAKEAKLRYRCVKTYAPDKAQMPFSVLEVELLTGRHHQIRVQLSHAGFPLVGDMKYGTRQSKELSEQLGIRNTALLAHELCFTHPGSGAQMCFSINYMERWQFLGTVQCPELLQI